MPIILHLQGGLGNQLFQYAAAKALATHHKMELVLDDSWFISTPKGLTPRHLMLNAFNIPEKYATHRKFLPKNRLLQKLILFFPRLNESIFHESNPFSYDGSYFDEVLSPERKYFLIGYWQSFKYFEHIRPTLQKTLKPKHQLSTHYNKLLEKIRATDSVMLHIRRGDYVTLKSASSLHGAIPLSYYLKSMAQILKWHPQAHFFVFSDDIKWAIENLPKEYSLTFVLSETAGEDSVISELSLMTQCKHHIIANSSLSWWGAWLSDGDFNQKIIAPSRWVNKIETNLCDLIPPAWVKISP